MRARSGTGCLHLAHHLAPVDLHRDFADTSCLITDINMPCMTGVEVHGYLVESGYDIPTILITAYPDDSTRARAMANGVICYLSKPLNDDALLGCVGSALKRDKP
jgi:FixJ family two-component response regulator